MDVIQSMLDKEKHQRIENKRKKRRDRAFEKNEGKVLYRRGRYALKNKTLETTEESN